jgi:hypothetical protein
MLDASLVLPAVCVNGRLVPPEERLAGVRAQLAFEKPFPLAARERQREPDEAALVHAKAVPMMLPLWTGLVLLIAGLSMRMWAFQAPAADGGQDA